MNTIKKMLAFVLLLGVTFYAVEAQAQVKYQISLLEDNQTYQVSLVSDVDWTFPQNVTSSAQITVKVPSEASFNVTNLMSLQEGINWTSNARINAPSESPEFDYISFALSSMGTQGINYVAGESVPLFSFTNLGACPGAVQLIDNELDPFAYPNSLSANVSNYISVAGAGGNAYSGNHINNTADCNATITGVNDNTPSNAVTYGVTGVSPNPATTFVNIGYQVAENAQKSANLLVVDVNGKIIVNKALNDATGVNTLNIDVENLASGIYFVQIQQGEDVINTSYKFVKINK